MNWNQSKTLLLKDNVSYTAWQTLYWNYLFWPLTSLWQCLEYLIVQPSHHSNSKKQQRALKPEVTSNIIFFSPFPCLILFIFVLKVLYNYLLQVELIVKSFINILAFPAASTTGAMAPACDDPNLWEMRCRVETLLRLHQHTKFCTRLEYFKLNFCVAFCFAFSVLHIDILRRLILPYKAWFIDHKFGKNIKQNCNFQFF